MDTFSAYLLEFATVDAKIIIGNINANSQASKVSSLGVVLSGFVGIPNSVSRAERSLKAWSVISLDPL